MAFALAVERIKKETNIGTLMRSAFNFGAGALFTIGRRYQHQAGDTVHAWRHIPLLHFLDWDDYRQHAPFAWQPIGVEITSDAHPLVSFVHPRHAVYLFGPEDGSLSGEALDHCGHRVVSIPSRLCLNVAVAAAVVMYDRLLKATEHRRYRAPLPLPVVTTAMAAP